MNEKMLIDALDGAEYRIVRDGLADRLSTLASETLAPIIAEEYEARRHVHGSTYHDHNPDRNPPTVDRMEILRVEFNRGIGCCDASPVRRVTRYLTLDGAFLGEHDPAPEAAP